MEKSARFNPTVIHMDITGKCNFSCLHCRGTTKSKELSLQDWKEIINKIAKYWANTIEWFEIGGGEPFMRKDLFEILQHIKRRVPNAKILLVTNGSLIKTEHLQSIKKFIDRIQFSLDGSKKETHDKIRNYPGSFDKVIQNIKRIKEEKIYNIIRATITKVNYSELEDIILLGKTLGVNEVGIRSMVISEGSSVLNNGLGLSLKEQHELLQRIPDLQSKHKIRIYSGDPLQNLLDPIFIKHIKNKGHKIENTFAGCLVGISYLYINNAGFIAFCPMLNNLVLGNALLEDPLEIWNNNVLLNDLRISKFSEDSNCATCRFKCVCGGCRARALFKNKDLLKQDPICDDNLREKINLLWEKTK